MADSWREYQEEAARFFRSLGAETITDFTVQGVRTTHDIDVFVKSHHVGFDVVWIVECKHWATRVTKLHVLALREIVADVGADRGFLLCEAGFQSGAVEAATLTNVHVSSLANLRSTASAEITAMRLRELYDRVESCRERYWNLRKQTRIEGGLRPDTLVQAKKTDIWELQEEKPSQTAPAFPTRRESANQLCATNLPSQANFTYRSPTS